MDLLQEFEPSVDLGITAAEKWSAMESVFGAEYAAKFRDGVSFQRRQFHAPPPKQFFRREFPLISRTLHLESVYRRWRDFNPDVLDGFAGLSAKKLADISTLLNTQTQRLIVLCKKNGMKQGDLSSFLHPDTVIVPIIAAGSAGFVAALERLDDFYTLTSSATMYGVLDGRQRKEAEMLCRKAVRAYGAMVRSESGKLRREAARVKAQGAVSDEVAAAEAAHEDGVRAYDSAVDAEAQVDPSARVEGEGAADLISSLAATASAQTAATKRAPRAKAKAADGEAAPAGATPPIAADQSATA